MLEAWTELSPDGKSLLLKRFMPDGPEDLADDSPPALLLGYWVNRYVTGSEVDIAAPNANIVTLQHVWM
jgi:hypothetical protein